MEKFPQPPPDRRLNRKSSQPQMQQIDEDEGEVNKYYKAQNLNLPKSLIDNHDNNKFFNGKYYHNDNIFDENYSNIDLIKQKNIEDIRKQIESFKILSDKKMFLNTNYNHLEIKFANFVLFGPSGSRTLFKSLYSVKSLPPNIIDKLIIKNSYENEGTLNFVRMILKEAIYEKEKEGIKICDTRGHLLMSSDEKEQFKLIVEGKVKDKQSKIRNPFLLWEFWRKKDETIFSENILNNDPATINTIPHCVILVFDGSSEDIINPDEVEFYRDLVSMCLARGYIDIHVILTKVDILEEMAFKRKRYSNNKDNINNTIHSIKDQQIEKVTECLGVKRSNIHFIENYSNEKIDNSVEIDYHVLKALNDMTSSSSQFLLMYYNRNTTCFSKCF